jgi:protein phosphatase 2C family protein 2/3
LGDCQLKEGNNRIVVPDPEISAFSPSKKDQFIIVATDGLWDVMSSQSAVEYVNNILVEENLLLGVLT